MSENENDPDSVPKHNSANKIVSTNEQVLTIHADDLTKTAQELADILSRSNELFCRGGPVKVITPTHALPYIQPMTVDKVVIGNCPVLC